MRRICSAPGTLSGFSNTEWTIANVAVFTPIQSASVNTTVGEKVFFPQRADGEFKVAEYRLQRDFSSTD